jgi:SEC-C motif-containing protein
MNGERAEAYLRLLAEEELRRPGWPRRVRSAAELLIAMGAERRRGPAARRGAFSSSPRQAAAALGVIPGPERQGPDSPAPGHLLSRPSVRPCENARMDRLVCPCGLGEDFASCCGRLHAGAPAPTAESLMRSRYSAFAVGDAGYLLRTWHPSRRPRTLSLDPGLRWTRLAVLATRDGGLFDATGTVQFRATYVQQGQRGVLAETSRFVRHDRHWTYLGPID